MFKKPSMGACFHNYIELLVLKVLQSHKDSSKEVTAYILQWFKKKMCHLEQNSRKHAANFCEEL
jgi:hypothetical protein